MTAAAGRTIRPSTFTVDPRQRLWSTLMLLAPLALLLTLPALVVSKASDRHERGAATFLLGCALLGTVAAVAAALRTRGGPVPAGSGVLVPEPAVPVATRFRRNARLAVQGSSLVVVDAAGTRMVAARDDVARVLVDRSAQGRPAVVLLVDAQDRVLLVVACSLLSPDEELRSLHAWADTVGLPVQDVTGRRTPGDGVDGALVLAGWVQDGGPGSYLAGLGVFTAVLAVAGALLVSLPAALPAAGCLLVCGVAFATAVQARRGALPDPAAFRQA